MKTLILIALFAAHPVFAAGKCLTVDLGRGNRLEVQQISKNDDNFIHFHLKKKHFSDSFYCTQNSGVYKCVGDDDGGTFYIDKKNNIKVDFIKIGNPDDDKNFMRYKGKSRWLKAQVKNCK